MIKAIMLIFEPALTWDRIALAQRSFRFVLMFFLVPLIFISVGAEMAGVLYLHRRQEMGAQIKLPLVREMAYGAAQLIFSFGVVFIGSKLVKSVAETFQNRNNYSQCFKVVAYSLSPLFLVRMFDAFPAMNPWASFAIGMVLSVATLYYGVPRILQPDPPHAFGLYLVSVLLLTGLAGLARFPDLAADGKIKYGSLIPAMPISIQPCQNAGLFDHPAGILQRLLRRRVIHAS